MIGIIAEYNPFHYGHLHHLNEVKKLFPNKTICLILAGHFLNRGEVSIVNKWDKTTVALQYGIDLVIELPFLFSSQAADIYAYGAISLLNHLKCEHVIFGSECNDIEKLKKIASISDENISKYLKQGYNYPKSKSLLTKEMINEEITTPNDLLGVSYIKAITKLKSSIIPLTIKRTSDYHNQNLTNKITSASSIRNALKNKVDISNYVPTKDYIKSLDINDLFLILKHKIYFEDLTKYQTVDTNLSSLLKKHIVSSSTITELIEKVKNKNNTYNKIKRSIVHILVNLEKKDVSNEIAYIRVLGFNKKGKNYLNAIKKEIKIPLYSKFNKQLQLEYNATYIYSLLTNDDILKKELTNLIKKDL